MATPGPRPIGVSRQRREGQLSIHTIRYRGLTDGQHIRIAGSELPADEFATNHQRRHKHVDVVIPNFNVEHSSGLILRFTDPLDITSLIVALDNARGLLLQRRPAPEEINLDEVPA